MPRMTCLGCFPPLSSPCAQRYRCSASPPRGFRATDCALDLSLLRRALAGGEVQVEELRRHSGVPRRGRGKWLGIRWAEGPGPERRGSLEERQWGGYRGHSYNLVTGLIAMKLGAGSRVGLRDTRKKPPRPLRPYSAPTRAAPGHGDRLRRYCERPVADLFQWMASFAVRATAGTTRRAGNLAVNRLPAPGVLSISSVA